MRASLLVFFILIGCTGGRSPQQSYVPKEQILEVYQSLQPINNPAQFQSSLSIDRLHPAIYLRARDFEAQSSPQLACKHYEFLTSAETFPPLLELSRLGLLRTCADWGAQRFLAHYPLDSWPQWIEESLLRTVLNSPDSIPHPELIVSLVDYERTQALKLEHLERALTLFPSNELLLEKKEAVAPRFIKRPAHDQLFSVARDFEQIREFDQARSLYEQIINHKDSSIDEVLQSFHRIAQTYRVQRQREIYWRELDQLAARLNALAGKSNDPRSGEAFVDNRITKARALWTAHQRSGGQAILIDILDSKLASQNQLAQIRFVLGAMETEAQNFLTAQEHNRSALEFEISDNRLLENLLWSYAWNYYLAQNYDAALVQFINGSQRHPEQAVQNKFLFWSAKTQERLNRSRDARKTYESLIQVTPYSYYGLLARHKLRRPLQPHKANREEPLKGTFAWLVFLNETEAAKNYLRQRMTDEELTPENVLRSLSQAELHDEAIFQFNRMLPTLNAKEMRRLLPYGFPKPYLDLYQHFGPLYGFSPELSMALTRQESAFNPVARSWADAFGLMQLIPERAREVASRLKLSEPTMDELFNPELNIQLGVFHLAELKKRFNGEFPYYIAAYNAGDRPVQTWRGRRDRDDVIEFIEMIPYRETQNYVKLIYRNAAIYRKLTTDRPFQLTELGLID
jgi:soluble lytic murein transglycosylase